VKASYNNPPTQNLNARRQRRLEFTETCMRKAIKGRHLNKTLGLSASRCVKGVWDVRGQRARRSVNPF